MDAGNSPNSVKRLVICIVVAVAAMVLGGIWFWPMYDEHRLHAQGQTISEGMPIADVLSRLGRQTHKDEFIEHNGETEDHYYWTRGQSSLKVVARNNVVKRVEWQDHRLWP